ncbi:glycoside hydrolase family 3 N-terminal domain-containing protein, partial [Flavobacterium sp.]|uniref:glycoside hydrolase family 3 N-terminal domain-containing protein n=1 Tax=Flavobacterium sp. TaxID=239 RepID=UPI00374CE5CD
VLFTVNCSVNKNRSKENNAITKNTDNPIIEKFIDPSKEGFNFFDDTHSEKKWVDSVYKTMNLDEKIGQLFVISAYSNRDETHFKSLDSLVEKYKVGGLLFLQGSAVKQAKLTNRLQSKSKIPLFITIDAEWGLNMRLDSTYKYPYNMTLGAIRDIKLIEKMGENMGRECKKMGIHFNFAPVLDINTNPKNPIIGNRSFGENKYEVTNRAIALMKGVQNQGVLSTGKHFPGHGDTEVDSHLGLPILKFDRQRLDSIEMFPYKPLFDKGMQSVMVAHLNVPSLEPKEGYPTSLSYKVVTELLQNQMKFKGLIFTDGLNMKGASAFRKSGELELECMLAGNDVLLNPENVPVAYERLKKAIQDTVLTEDRLKHSVIKILKYKYKAGLNKYKPIDVKNIVAEINPIENTSLQYELYENALTVIKNKNDILPLKDLSKEKIAYIKLGEDSGNNFLATLKKYAEVTDVSEVVKMPIDSLDAELKEFNSVIIGLHKSDKSWWKIQDFTDNELLLIEKIAENKKVILDVFTKPYSLSKIKSFENISSVIVSYQNGDIAQQVSAELIFGAIAAKGKLPVSVNENYKEGFGLSTKKISILGFGTPESVGMNSETLSKIESIVKKAIDGKMTPGAQVLVARKGKVIYQKSFGFHSYKKEEKVKNSDIYDVASLTKIVSTLPNVMQQYEKGNINLETRLGSMIPEAKGTDKDSIKLKDFLSHYARLQAWIPFYKSTLDSNKAPLKKYYRKTVSSNYKNQIAENLFIRNDYNDTIIKTILNSKLLEKKQYVYSDFTFILLKEYLEKVNNKTLDVISQENFFSKLGMNNTLYNPLQKFDMSVIPPTEVDTYFRHQLLQGYVHDMGAAMQGGVAGHAGIFSNTMDIAKIMQMYLQKGKYGDVQYFSEKTFNDFNTCYFCAEGNRRGLGLDKPQITGTAGPTCGCASLTSFGHTGFTGTMTWVDPETEIVYVFLSNRTFPDSNAPNKLSKENIREDIQKIIYEAIIK